MVFEDFSVKEELHGRTSLKGRTTGHEIFNSLYSLYSMIGQVNGFIAICRQHDDFPASVA
jgi:hypothetical protein